MIVFGIRLKKFKAGFFDRDAIKAALGVVTHEVLNRFGGFTRKTARRSIKPAPKTKRSKRAGGGQFFGQLRSRPGDPPFSHTGLLRDFIFYAFDLGRRSVVIGPARLTGRSNTAPHALEYGGPSRAPNGVIVNIRKRPYMNPAFTLAQKELPKFWREAARKA